MSERATVLARIRAALADVPEGEGAAWSPEADDDPAASYIRHRTLAPEQLTDLFAERCGEYQATVTRCGEGPEEIGAAVAEACRRHGAEILAFPPGLDDRWRPAGIERRIDDPHIPLEELDRCHGVLTGCALAIALTGTIVLDSGPGQGRRALSLIPDLHVCVVLARQIVPGLPEAFAALEPAVLGGRPVTFVSGPSATSDIELRRVEGVHGPRRLEVVLAAGVPEAI